MTDHPDGAVRLFTNRSGASDVFPDGLVTVDHHSEVNGDGICVVYLHDVEGIGGRKFYAHEWELSAVGAVTLRPEDTWVVQVPGLPTFYLNGAVQGISHRMDAAKIASQIIGTQASVGPSDITRLAD